jgi:hypothetical protein
VALDPLTETLSQKETMRGQEEKTLFNRTNDFFGGEAVLDRTSLTVSIMPSVRF